jgi:hypothetical protein
MFDVCTGSEFNSVCDFFSNIQNFFSWFDQRINVNEGVIALVALLVAVGMQNFTGARRIAGLGFLVLAVIFGLAAILEGPSRTLKGVPPFRVTVPSVFRNVHSDGDGNSIIASDEPGKNSVQLLSGSLHKSKPADYLKGRCPGDLKAFAERNEIDDPSSIVFSFIVPPGKVSPNGCYFSWHEKNNALDHYEVYVVHQAPDGGGWEYGRMHLRAEKPTHVLVREDYVTMRNSLLKSADITPPQD